MASVTQRDALKAERPRKSKPVPVGWAVGPHGKPFPCNMARHIGSLSDFGFYEVLARLCNLADAERENRDIAPGETPERGTLCASLLTIADAAGVSLSTARAKMEKLEKLGLLADHRKGTRKRGGWFDADTYSLVTHLEFAATKGCPAPRFDRHRKAASPRVSPSTILNIDRMRESATGAVRKSATGAVRKSATGAVRKSATRRVREFAPQSS